MQRLQRHIERVLLIFGIYTVILCRGTTVDVCTGYRFTATCKPDELIVMTSAEYGRMEPGKCIGADRGNFGCTNDILFLTDRWCSGRKDCEFTVPNSDIIEANTNCIDLVAYLKASYSCTKVTGLGASPCSFTSPNIVRSDDKTLASYVTEERGCGSLKSPWVIQANAGQTVEISLLDFKALDRARGHSLVTCSDVYGFIVEKTLNINQTICGQSIRESVIYRSKTNRVQIYIVKNSGANFMIKYKANGCSDPKPPPRAWYKRNGNEAVVGCETNDKQWRLTCSGNTWQGQIGNCTSLVSEINNASPEKELQFELSTIVIVAGIIGGTIVLAVAVIVCGVVYIQKYKDRKEKKYNESINPESLNIPGQPSGFAHCKPISSNVTQTQDDYLEPNLNTESDKCPAKVDEPLIHIWETPLPDPSSAQLGPTSRESTVHRKPKQGQVMTSSNPATARKDPIRTGTSYYSPNTGHKYYVVDRET